MRKKMTVKVSDSLATLLVVLGLFSFLMLVTMISHFRINGLQTDIQILYAVNTKLAIRLSKVEKLKMMSEQPLTESRQDEARWSDPCATVEVIRPK